jgi:hypothetical protein
MAHKGPLVTRFRGRSPPEGAVGSAYDRCVQGRGTLRCGTSESEGGGAIIVVGFILLRAALSALAVVVRAVGSVVR